MSTVRSSVVVDGKLNCANPLRVLAWLLCAVGAAMASMLFYPSLLTLAAAVSMVLATLRMVTLDRNRPLCTSLRLTNCQVRARFWDDDCFRVVLAPRSAHLSFVFPDLRLRRTAMLRQGARDVVLIAPGPDTSVFWQESDAEIELEELAEISGALDVVLKGDRVCVESVFGKMAGTLPQLLAVRVSSSAGAVQSWRPGFLRPPSRFGVTRRAPRESIDFSRFPVWAKG